MSEELLLSIINSSIGLKTPCYKLVSDNLNEEPLKIPRKGEA